MRKIRDAVIDYGMERYDVAPDHPFEKYPSYFVLRHKDNEKWFALLMDVPKSRIGLKGEEIVDILDVKCYPDEIDSLRKRAGYFSAYHMNKEHWLTVILDGTVSLDEIERLIDQSFKLTA